MTKDEISSLKCGDVVEVRLSGVQGWQPGTVVATLLRQDGYLDVKVRTSIRVGTYCTSEDLENWVRHPLAALPDTMKPNRYHNG